MPQATNPYSAPNNGVSSSVPRHPRLRRFFTLLTTACIGIVIGSYISAELLHLHFPEETRSTELVFQHTFAAVLTSPISMTFGVYPTIGFYGTHGFLVIPGALLTIAGTVAYLRQGMKWGLMIALAGFVLWSHNNYLGFNALMSV